VHARWIILYRTLLLARAPDLRPVRSGGLVECECERALRRAFSLTSLNPSTVQDLDGRPGEWASRNLGLALHAAHVFLGRRTLCLCLRRDPHLSLSLLEKVGNWLESAASLAFDRVAARVLESQQAPPPWMINTAQQQKQQTQGQQRFSDFARC
jgi:hypothetical protein